MEVWKVPTFIVYLSGGFTFGDNIDSISKETIKTFYLGI